ncbi:hypothetical protein [Neotamlana laminarinivorans]|uniref:Uncharacterized protein n=1 Tax=Neotamlana laminarinivorans TaxID=2883124 RepID=A0A9X1L4N0_9FLAO|nr:hypothetical protein [Tamlana laminarinivorans]MCB4798491.1 hypothetical protein [Tamlana laminarinivorans]
MMSYYVISVLIFLYTIIALTLAIKLFLLQKKSSDLETITTSNNTPIDLNYKKLTFKLQTIDFIENLESLNDCSSCHLASKNQCDNSCVYKLNDILEVKLKLRAEVNSMLNSKIAS